jgi:hypothetical protein
MSRAFSMSMTSKLLHPGQHQWHLWAGPGPRHEQHTTMSQHEHHIGSKGNIQHAWHFKKEGTSGLRAVTCHNSLLLIKSAGNPNHNISTTPLLNCFWVCTYSSTSLSACFLIWNAAGIPTVPRKGQ